MKKILIAEDDRFLQNIYRVKLTKEGFEVVYFKSDDGIIWLPNILDRTIGRYVYGIIEMVFKPIKNNPWSNIMLLVVRKVD